MGWSDCDTYSNHDVLARIVALLFALANLADRAAFCPARRRREVLFFLIEGEAEARAFALETALGVPVEADEPAFFDDAAGLAARLRLLAFVLWFLLVPDRRLARPPANPRTLRRGPVGRPAPAGLSAAHNGRSALPPPDT